MYCTTMRYCLVTCDKNSGSIAGKNNTAIIDCNLIAINAVNTMIAMIAVKCSNLQAIIS